MKSPSRRLPIHENGEACWTVEREYFEERETEWRGNDGTDEREKKLKPAA
jgi:hypothetical protein